ncbi:MAG: hypothetical protein LM574_07510, partial [Archaeoglobus sp.]|nr:hypothetical protein [Archaeoglobus sp.]
DAGNPRLSGRGGGQKNYQYNLKAEGIKMEILLKFKMEDLRRICKVKGISTKKVVRTDFDPEKFSIVEEKAEITRKDELARRMAAKLSLEEIIHYAKKYGVNYQKELEELKDFEKELFETGEEETKDSVEDYEKKITEVEKYTITRAKYEFEELLKTIRDKFKPETVRNEEDLEKQLYQFLSGKLSERRIERQVYVEGSMRIDLVVDGKYGIEVKIADSAQKLHTLTGQVLFYRENFEEVIAVILETGANVDIDKFARKLEEYGIHVIRLFGTVKRLGKKGDVIIIKRR